MIARGCPCYARCMLQAFPPPEAPPRLITSLIPIPLAVALAMLVLLFG